MVAPRVSAEEFERIWHEEGGSPAAVARRIGVEVANVYQRRKRLERDGASLPTNPDRVRDLSQARYAYPRREHIHVEDGWVVCFGDMHARPLAWREDGDTLAMQTLLAWLDVYGARVSALVCMGDALDLKSLSRHPPIGWDSKPSVADEVGGAQHDLRRIAERAPEAERVWCIGNHDERFNRFLSTRTPEFENVLGFGLADSFSDWRMAWSAMVNGSLLLLHRWHTGVHAVHSNLTKAGGAHVGTADTHRLRVYPYSGQLGTLYGFETGCLADPTQSFFEYTRGLDPNWQPGFIVARFRDGVMEPPQPIHAGERFRVVVQGRALA